MTTLKFDTKLGASANSALEPHIRPLYDKPDSTRLAIVEIRHVERTQPATESDKDPSVKVRIVSCEVPSREQEAAIREAQHALYVMRTAVGTLNEEGELELAKQTLRYTGGHLHAIETARLRAGLSIWVDYARRVKANDKLTFADALREIDAIHKGMLAVLNDDVTAGDDND